MSIKYQVFISSTFQDLEHERRTVIEQILNLGHIPVGMELFQAGDQSQWVYIQERIKECDYYIVIVSERYGSEGSEGKSYTQMEYEFAVAQNVPVAAFLLHNDARKTLPRERVEFEKREKVEAFRRLCETRMAKYWKNADDLGSRVLTALSEMMHRTPRVGWVRADSVATAAALNEIAKLSEERRSLQEEIDQLKLEQSGLIVPSDMAYRLEKMSQSKVSDFIKDYSNTNMSIIDLFIYVNSELSLAFPWRRACITICGMLCTNDQAGAERIIKEFVAQNLLDASHNGKSTIVQLSDYGKTFAMHARRQQAPSDTPVIYQMTRRYGARRTSTPGASSP
ncbi:DUF4062 domain-containing protein [Methylosinus sp. RM1]|uniref:DUF4062 domain-containing protein n=1 Tax=Methylosinus sp. RM1 TaxID=2583817 RepID=UPI00140D0136|nr:DUF4062 domain-containing protein [Methylosinus sp. RM1]